MRKQSTNITPQQRMDMILPWFRAHQPVVKSELNYDNTFHLLIAVMLSAQCTDKRVNMVTPHLFQRFPTPKSLATATFEEVFSEIASISYPNNKAKHLIGMAKMLVDEFDSQVPCTPGELERLPGVGRKTANVVSAVAFNLPRMAVDTHIFRVCNRLGVTKAKSPLQSEQQLIKLIKEEEIPLAHHWFLLHGRYVCMARKPHCEKCPFTECCNFFKSNATK
ncbi:MAG: endonuclease III [Bacteroidales bacterium]|nr:endonuclease III [Bacteroidales bacterium]